MPVRPSAFILLPSISEQTVCRRFTNSVLWCSLREVLQTFMTLAQRKVYFSRDVNVFLSVVSTFIIHLGEIGNSGYAHNTAQKLWILEKSAQERSYFFMSASEINVCLYHINVRHFESKERVGKVFELRHGHAICNAVIRNGWGRVIWICLNSIDSKTLLQIFFKRHATYFSIPAKQY
jgi:hypothetical protein